MPLPPIYGGFATTASYFSESIFACWIKGTNCLNPIQLKSPLPSTFFKRASIAGNFKTNSSGIWIKEPKVFACSNKAINSAISDSGISPLPMPEILAFNSEVMLSGFKSLLSIKQRMLGWMPDSPFWFWNRLRSSSLAFIVKANMDNCAARSSISKPNKFFCRIKAGISLDR